MPGVAGREGNIVPIATRVEVVARAPGSRALLGRAATLRSTRVVRRAFPQLSRAQARRIASVGQRVTVQTGALVTRRGEIADRLWVVVKGDLDVIYPARPGADRIIGHLGRGEAFGEIGVLRGSTRTASVVARGPCELLMLNRGAVTALTSMSLATRVELIHLARRRLDEQATVKS